MGLTSFTRMDDYKTDDGHTDWRAYKAAQQRNGESCTGCGKYLALPTGKPETCHQCDELKKPSESFSHDEYVRCPHCLHFWRPRDHETYAVFEDGEHDIYCHQCDKEFTVSTHISFSWTSLTKDDE